jgi:hypothetical protein
MLMLFFFQEDSLVPNLEYYWQAVWFNLAILATWGADLHMAMIDPVGNHTTISLKLESMFPCALKMPRKSTPSCLVASFTIRSACREGAFVAFSRSCGALVAFQLGLWQYTM